MWDSILNGCGWVLYQLAQFVGDWGLAIIIITLIIRFILYPLQKKQYKSSFQMRKFQPKLKEIQERFAGDQQKIQEETQKLYQETGFNPLAGCLPMLIQMPVFIILFQVLNWKIAYYAHEGVNVSFYQILPNLTATVSSAFSTGIIYSIPYIIFAVLFLVVSIIPMIIQIKDNPSNANQTKIMIVFMAIMFGYMALISPAGVVLYWTLSSGFGVVQQLLTNHRLEKEDEELAEEIYVQPIEVNVERKPKKKRPKKIR